MAKLWSWDLVFSYSSMEPYLHIFLSVMINHLFRGSVTIAIQCLFNFLFIFLQLVYIIVHFRRLRWSASVTTTWTNTMRVCATMSSPYWSMCDYLMAVVVVKRNWAMRTLIVTWASYRHYVHPTGTVVMRATDPFMRQWNQHCRTSLFFLRPSSHPATFTVLLFQPRSNFKIDSDCFQLIELQRQWKLSTQGICGLSDVWLAQAIKINTFKWHNLSKVMAFAIHSHLTKEC